MRKDIRKENKEYVGRGGYTRKEERYNDGKKRERKGIQGEEREEGR